MPKALAQYNHPTPACPQYTPHAWTKPAYGQKIQFAPQPDKTFHLTTKDQRRIQSIVTKFLYYGRGVDSTMLPALGDIFTAQTAPTETTVKKTSMLMDYLHTFLITKLRFYAGDM